MCICYVESLDGGGPSRLQQRASTQQPTSTSSAHSSLHARYAAHRHPLPPPYRLKALEQDFRREHDNYTNKIQDKSSYLRKLKKAENEMLESKSAFQPLRTQMELVKVRKGGSSHIFEPYTETPYITTRGNIGVVDELRLTGGMGGGGYNQRKCRGRG